ncbi:amino acid adenylation domain-containing protein [Streptomyces sp. AV19]|uniref:non-ribosomal peptide synthetase n=1 Tax=Streptomyces sp. AV19 TaxID=2793068 RepID=UPI0018FE78E5|nr:non-ribosomal peptide synthetase [Streptomyces sp. AV19]MBH1937502.1 amino acid adenylation domain-containing protein [Streptomyces sp. AV19]MDG4533722.1 non-ribosomal peptide synthetase [Streptomyces sp. AV19]
MAAPDRETGRRPLLAAQEGIWTGQQLDLDSPAFNTAEYVEIHGPIDTTAFERALRDTVAGTEALNVRFVLDDGRPWQTTEPAGDWQPHTADLTALADPRAAALDWMARDIDRPVDLTREPVFGHALFKIAEDRWLWYHRVHHIALDGFGLALVARRVADTYTALIEGTPLAPSGFGTLESVRAEERAYRESRRCAEDRAYWTGRFADRPAVASLTDRQALPARTFLRRVTDLGPTDVEPLRALARELSVTWSDLMVAATAGYIHRVSRERDIVLSLPVMGRLGSVSLRVPGMVRNILALRVTVEDGDGLRDLAQRVSGELRAALPHQRYRYEQLRRDLKLVGGGRRLSGPGVNVMPFEYDLRFAGHRSSVHNVSAGPVDDLSVNVYDRAEGRGLRIAVDGNPGLYTEAELATHQRGLLDLLREGVAAPGRPLRELRPLAVLDGGPLPGPARPVLERIAEHAARRGDATAVEHDGRSVTYAELLAAARTVARHLAARGAGPGTLVAVALPRGIEAVTAILGALLSGAAYCPLDPAAPASRTAALLDDAGPAVVLTSEAHAPAFGDRAVLMPGLMPGREDDAPAAVASGDLAYVIYTSGSTGRPKGVEIGHGALAHFVTGAAHRYGLRREDRVLQFAPLHFDASVEEIFLTLCTGATLVVRTDEMTESVPGLLDACGRLGVSVLDLPTAYWHELAYAVSTGAAALPPGLRTVVIGGEAALPERVDRWREAVGPSVRLFNTYGPTEATVVATVAELHDPALAPGDVPIGRPLPGLRAAVLDGELHLVGDALALGYRGGRAPDDARFAPLPQLPGSPRAYRTGDLVRLGDDGQLRFAGRADDEFKISGHRVQPAEVETVLLAHPGVREAAVVGQVLPDGTRRLVAHVAADAGVAAAGLREHLRAALPAAMVPSAVEFTDRLPRTGSGKIDRNALGTAREPAATAPTGGGSVERVITGLWAQVLGVEGIDPGDDVFDLGAQSLQAIQVANRLGVELGRDVRVAWLFQYPTAARLAGFLGREAREEAVADGLPEAVLADAALDEDIRPGRGPRPSGAPRRILLTGATGFVGSHLLAELLATTDAGIVCPVRAADADQARERLRRAFAAQRLAWPADGTRVTAVPADLARPRLGLSAGLFAELAGTCDAIVHNAATVSIMRDYSSLRAANTEATRQLLRLAAERVIPLHLVSTLSVAPPRSASPEVPEAFLPPHPGLAYGYQQSKWASERLLEQAAQRGLPVTLHRLGRVTGPAATGFVNERDFLWSVLRSGIPAGILPELFEAEVWTPVDYVARAVVRLSLTAPPGTVFNHAPVPQVRLNDVYDWVQEYGYAVKRLPLGRWREELPRSADVAATTGAFLDSWTDDSRTGGSRTGGSRTGDSRTGGDGDGDGPGLGLGEVRADNVLRGLDGTGIACPQADRALMFRYLDHCVEAGVLPAPPGKKSGPRGNSAGSAADY